MTANSSKTNVRKLAATSCIRILDDGELSHIVIDEAICSAQGLDDRDRAFFVRLVKITMENLFMIDHVIEGHSNTRIKKMKPLVRETLRTAVCQILYFDQIPDRAVCDEAVKIIKKSGYKNLSGFVNAVLRAIVNDDKKDVIPDDMEPEDRLCMKYSMPGWITKMFLNRFGLDKTTQIFEYYSSDPGTTLRVNLSKVRGDNKDEKIKRVISLLEEENVTVLGSGRNDECLHISDSGDISNLSVFSDGMVTVQDESSYIAVKSACHELSKLKSSKPEDDSSRYIIYDICAAPGGKTMACAELLGNNAEIWSFDISGSKCNKIRKNVKRCGYDQVHVLARDARKTLEQSSELITGQCDLLICDLPCSGLGIISRKKDIRYRIKESDLADLADLQRKILIAADTLLKKGGLMLYSTCTIDTAENEEQTKWLESTGKYTVIKTSQMLPGIDGCDGFYYAILKKEA